MTFLLLRADAAPTLGVGHLSRCVALATAARARGWDVALCGDVTAGQWLIGDLAVLPELVPADVVLIDHYGLDEVTLPSLVVSMEDGTYGRRRADIVVDANLYETPRPDDGSPIVLRGPAYAPLRAEILAARETRDATPQRAHDTTPLRVGGAALPRVVVVMGGGAAPSAVASAVTALRETGVPAEIVAISASPVPGVDVIPPTPELPTLLASADLVVSAAGVTLMELCCIGAPAALVRIAENQRAGYEAAVGKGLAAGLGVDPREHVDTLRTLLKHPSARKALGDKAKQAVDGKGADRILDAMGFDPVVREARKEDAGLLLVWRNDPDTRAWSRTTDTVSAADHTAWLELVLDDPERRLLIAERGNRPIGTVRFDRGGDHWEVSITVAPEARGKKLAVPMLLAAERTVKPANIKACVHKDNAASVALFHKAGYQRDSSKDHWVWFAKSV